MKHTHKTIVSKVILITITTIFIFSGCSYSSQESYLKENDIKIKDQKQKDIIIDQDYLLSLNTGNQFLHAWLVRDFKEGEKYLTKEIQNKMTEEELIMYFTGLSNPHHQGFEISGAEKIDENTMRFRVWLYEYYTGEDTKVKRGSPTTMDIVKVGKDTYGQDIWLVNKLPLIN